MIQEQKKSILLLKAIIFSYHGIKDNEKSILAESAEQIDGSEELEWVYDFLNKDSVSTFERAKSFFQETIANYDTETKLAYLSETWDAASKKGYVTEMEAMAMLTLAKDWKVQKELLGLIRKKNQ
ncbi:hypothetical protein RCC89_04850 [Cytophagaceae bacterium ABcell3]|nr:hypothetical protein RCC89_04850 [Cytophagaceae bacterium ABcell3]